VVSVVLPSRIKIEELAKKINSLCGPQIAVRDAQWVDASFHARFSAIWRHYRYTILNTPAPDPFSATTAWHVYQPLEIRPMQLASDAVMGERDFSAFCRKPSPDDADDKRQVTMVRFVMQAAWKRLDEHVTFDVRANAFCHQMVRSIVGTMIDVGHGKLHAGDMRGIMLRADRAAAGQVAPPQGLSLWEVGYEAPRSVSR
jgi:tRNA pseudouridine38-40 synthase